MPTGSTRGDVDLLRYFEFGFRDLHFVEENVSGFLGNSPQSGIADGPWLLVNFFEHEVLEAAFFRHDWVPGNVLHLAHDRLAIEIGEAHSFGRNDCQVTIGEEE